MAASTSNEAEKKEDMVCEEADSNQEDSAAGDEEEGPGSGQNKAEENEVVTVGSTYPCKKADGSLHDAEVVKTRMNKQLGKEEYYVHYIGLNRRQNEWVDKTRLVLTKAEVKEEAKDEASGNNQEMADATEQANGNTPQGQKRKLEEQEPETKKTKVEAAPNSSLVGPAGDFAEELTCHLCVELFKDPVMVECGHNFCKACIEKAWAGQDSFSCPECKEVINDKKYTINRALANLVKKTATAPVIPAEKKEKPLENCPEHDERLKLYCKDDGTLGCIICRDSLKHVSHNFLPILDAVAVYREQLAAIVAPLEASLKVSEQVVSQQNEKIVQHKNNICEYKDHIVAEFERMHEFLEEREKVLLAQLQEQGDGLLKEMEQNMVKMQENIDGIKKTIAVAKDRVDENDSISFLTDIKAFIDKCLEQQREVVSSSGNTLLSKELCQGTFKGPIQYILWKEIKKAIVPYLSPMLLDPSTAHPNLILSDGLTSVKYGDNKLSVPDNPKRFSQCILVLGSVGFDSGRHYWEVDVGDKTAWDVGMASESSNRKGKIKLNPKNGYWAIWLRNGNAYKALESPSKALSLTSHPRKIGVYVDYEGGQISFYNADNMTIIYTFSATFTEKLYPYLSPFLHDSGKNVDALRFVHNQ